VRVNATGGDPGLESSPFLDCLTALSVTQESDALSDWAKQAAKGAARQHSKEENVGEGKKKSQKEQKIRRAHRQKRSGGDRKFKPITGMILGIHGRATSLEWL